MTGDARVNTTDRQILYANYGLRANQAPVAAASLPVINTHTDLSKGQSLASVAQDLEGDVVFWRVLDATHGTARLSADGLTLLFTPEAGYTGQATVRVQADDGFAAVHRLHSPWMSAARSCWPFTWQHCPRPPWMAEVPETQEQFSGPCVSVNSPPYTREEVVLNFGVNKCWERGPQGALEIELNHRIVLSSFAAQRLSELLQKLM